jgi:DNA-binding NarL/FixJ family response regulator
VKILLTDDHTLFREGMRHVLLQLADDVEVIEAGNFGETLERAAATPDIGLVLLDLAMPGKDGFAALDTLSRLYPLLPIVVLSASESPNDMQRALDAGAMGFIPKAATASVMLNALRLVLAGGIYVPPELVGGRGSPMAPALTPRQVDVLARVVEGKSNKVIAAELGLTVATVKAHITSAFKALNVTNRTQAALAAERLGLKQRANRGG